MTHGTYSGHQMHLRRHEKSCDECQAAARDYMREYRAARADVRAAERRASAARSRALTRLARKYPHDYRRFRLDELAKEPR